MISFRFWINIIRTQNQHLPVSRETTTPNPTPPPSFLRPMLVCLSAAIICMVHFEVSQAILFLDVRGIGVGEQIRVLYIYNIPKNTHLPVQKSFDQQVF